jgi:hypothetical protein
MKYLWVLSLLGFLFPPLAAQANIEKHCIGVDIGKHGRYTNCKIITPTPQQIARELESDAILKFRSMKNQIDQMVISNWKPPMGFSGYRVNVSYKVDKLGKLRDIEIENTYLNEELKNSIIQAMLSIDGIYIPDNEMLKKELNLTRITSSYLVH